MRGGRSLLEAAQAGARHAAQSTSTNAFIRKATPEYIQQQLRRDPQASQSEYGISQTTIDKLRGKQIAVKDNISTHDFPTTCASKGLKSYVPPFDATVVSRLRTTGAVVAGKTNLDEFGMGSHSTHSYFGSVQNLKAGYSAGGSSGGSAVAVASGECYGALGTDTGGSVRLPAAFNGVYGFKPSYGIVSRWGVVPYANSLDTVGFLSNTLDSLQAMFDAAKGYDNLDPTSVKPKTLARLHELISKREKSRTVRIGVPSEYSIEELSPIVRDVWIKVLKLLQRKGHSIQLISLPATHQALSAYYVLGPAEASSNLAKYDNVRYGNKEEESDDAASILFSTARKTGFGEEVRRRILLGSYSLSAEAMDNYFIQAQKIRRLMKRDFDRAFSMPNVMCEENDGEYKDAGVDCILCPTAHTLAPALEDVSGQSPLETYASDVFTVPASLSGIPAMSVPFTSVSSEHSPPDRPAHVGIQIMTQYGDDNRAFEISKLLEECCEEVGSR